MRAGLLAANGIMSRTVRSTRSAIGTAGSGSTGGRASMRRHSTSASRWSFELKYV